MFLFLHYVYGSLSLKSASQVVWLLGFYYHLVAVKSKHLEGNGFREKSHTSLARHSFYYYQLT